jgi:hypothetical protein
MDEALRDLSQRSRLFERAAHDILQVHEGSASRIVVLDETYKKLSTLSLNQDDLMRQALRCAEEGLFRASHVMAWAAFMDYYEEKLNSDGLIKVRALRPIWHTKDLDELREYQSEYQLIELAQPLSLCSKNEMKALLGLLNKRNQCAHPSSYFPALNETLGFVSDVLQYIRLLGAKTL